MTTQGHTIGRLPGLALLVLTAVAGLVSFQQAVGQVLARTAPAVVLRANPGNPAANTRKVEVEFAAGQGKRPLRPDQRSSLQYLALRAEPLSRDALRLLALDADLTGKPDRAGRLMRMSNQVSRRDVPTQLWLLQQAALRGDWIGGLHRLDVIMTVAGNLRQPMYGQIIPNLGNPSMRSALVPLLRDDRPWSIGFVETAVRESRDPTAVAALLASAAPLPHAQQMRDVEGYVVARLVAVGKVEEAAEFATRVLRSDPRSLKTFAVTPATTEAAIQPLTWQLGTGPDVWASAGADGSVVVRLSGPSRASAMTRYFVPFSARARVSYIAEPAPESEAIPANWVVQCANGEVLAQVISVPVQFSGKTEAFDIALPSGCAGVRIDLLAGGGDTGGEDQFSVKPLELSGI